jgi:hypothetical protein
MTKPALLLLRLAINVRDILDAGDVVNGIVAEWTAIVGATFVACCFDLEWMNERSETQAWRTHICSQIDQSWGAMLNHISQLWLEGRYGYEDFVVYFEQLLFILREAAKGDWVVICGMQVSFSPHRTIWQCPVLVVQTYSIENDVSYIQKWAEESGDEACGMVKWFHVIAHSEKVGQQSPKLTNDTYPDFFLLLFSLMAKEMSSESLCSCSAERSMVDRHSTGWLQFLMTCASSLGCVQGRLQFLSCSLVSGELLCVHSQSEPKLSSSSGPISTGGGCSWPVWSFAWHSWVLVSA